MARIQTIDNVKHRDYIDHDDVVNNEELKYSRYGGFHLGAALFGWLVSTGIGAILLGIITAAGISFALTSMDQAQILNPEGVDTIGFISGVIFLAVLAISYFAGGYVAGRMSRFNGALQGFGVWAVGLVLTILVGILGSLFGSNYNVLQQMNLPHIPIDQGSFTTGGIIAMIVALIVSLLAAVSGGRTGENYHRKIDHIDDTNHSLNT